VLWEFERVIFVPTVVVGFRMGWASLVGDVMSLRAVGESMFGTVMVRRPVVVSGSIVTNERLTASGEKK
jgi:hypothetical protein